MEDIISRLFFTLQYPIAKLMSILNQLAGQSVSIPRVSSAKAVSAQVLQQEGLSMPTRGMGEYMPDSNEKRDFLYIMASDDLRKANAPAEWFEALEKAKAGDADSIKAFQVHYLERAEKTMKAATDMIGVATDMEDAELLELAKLYMATSNAWGALRGYFYHGS